MKKVFQNMILSPEKTFPFLQTRATAYFLLYFLPIFLVMSLVSATILYDMTEMMGVIIFVALVYFVALVGKGYQTTNDAVALTNASETVLPGVIEKYFKRQYPASDVAMMLSGDRKHWVCYGHIEKERMARIMTHMDYHLMPPPPQVTDYFLRNAHHVKHQWLTIVNPDTEQFRISDRRDHNIPSYPVTVFDRDDAQ